MKKMLGAALICAMAMPAYAGGPVVIEDEDAVVEPARKTSILIPLLALVAVGILLTNDKEEVPPTETCNDCE